MIWTDSGSTIVFNKTIKYSASSGWVIKKIREGLKWVMRPLRFSRGLMPLGSRPLIQ
ncbi:MAG: hypothetical protein QW491_14765 [Thermoproteota archaeon]|nr:hypothetical protein [Candidatus Brockarchaeota archaeon]